MNELLLPPFGFLVLLLVLAFTKWKRSVLFWTSFTLLILCSTPIVGYRLLSLLENASPALRVESTSNVNSADAVVVLGAGRNLRSPEFDGEGSVSSNSLERLRYGALLARQLRKPILVTGGSPVRSGKSEAELMQITLTRDFQIPAKWTETASLNTRENAEFSAKILMPLGIRRIFLVTHAFHMPRAKRSFEHVGFSVVPAPMGFLSADDSIHWQDCVPGVRGMELNFIAFHEYIGYFWYQLLSHYR